MKQTNFEKIEKRLISIMSKKYVAAKKQKQQIISEASAIEEYGDIIEKTINNYNYNGHNFNPAYLPVIIAMALKEQEFNIVQDVAWNSLSKERPCKETENSILKENLSIILEYVEKQYDSVKGNATSEFERGFDEGNHDAIRDLKYKIKMMTEEDEVDLATKADRGYVRLE